MRSIILNNKYELLKNKLNVGDIVKPKIVKNISQNKSIATIKGYNVVVENDNTAENNNSEFVVLGFNDKEKLVLLKKIIRNNFTQNQNLDFIVELLRKKNIPVNGITLNIGDLLYRKFGEINDNLFMRILKYAKELNVPEFILFLINSGLDDSDIKSYLNKYKSLLMFLNLTNKKIDKPDKKNRGSFIFSNFDDILELLKSGKIIDKNFFNALLKQNSDFELYLLHLFLANAEFDGSNRVFFSVNNDKEEVLKFKARKDKKYFYIKIEYSFGGENVILKLLYDFNRLHIKVESFSKFIINLAKKEKENILYNLKKIIKDVSFDIDLLGEKTQNFDIYI